MEFDWLGGMDSEESKYLIRIRDAVKRLYEEDKESYGPIVFYTPHGPEHCERVEHLFHHLIPDPLYLDLETKERLYLLASAWLHDIGMLRSVATQIHGKGISDYDIRDKHHTTTGHYIVNYYKRCGLDEIDKHFMGDLCFYHRRKEDINNCRETTSVGLVSKPYRLQLLAAYLRLADSLDVGIARASLPAYSNCLAYNISAEYKLHWIKNRVVQGININAEKHKITAEFRKPDFRGLDNHDIMEEKFGYITKLVLDDIRDEISSVMNVLVRNNISYYLDADMRISEGFVSDQMLNDLRELMINYDIMVHPSASKLIEMIIITIADIAGFNIQSDKAPVTHTQITQQNEQEIRKNLEIFYIKLREEVLNTRRCHFGVRNVLTRCEKTTKEYLKESTSQKFIRSIDNLYQRHQLCRRQVRDHAADCFSKVCDFSGSTKVDNGFNILLFGYSELVIKAICGLRDCLLKSKHPGTNPKYLFNSTLERDISNLIHIFICECQPKTQTEVRDRLLYYDGSGYALALHRRNFLDITIIPDIVVANIIENNALDMLIIGANGFDNRTFLHSAGHGSVVRLTREYGNRSGCSSPNIILVVSSEKYSNDYPGVTRRSGSVDTRMSNVDGCLFVEGYETLPSRKNIWMTRDRALMNELFNKGIKFYNPREDVVPIGFVDYIISDAGWFEMNPGAREGQGVEQNIQQFLEKIEKTKRTLIGDY